MSNFNFDLEDWIYDIESYPNLFTFVAWKLYDPTDIHIFVKYGERDDLDKLREFLKDKNKRLTGHNSLFYDRPMLLSILRYKDIDEFALGRLTKLLIETPREDRRDNIPNYYDIVYPKSIPWGMSLDTMAITRVNRAMVSLKNAGIHLHHNKLQDLPIPPTRNVEPHEVDLIIAYNINDVEIQQKLTKILRPKFDAREFVSEKFETDVTTSNNTAIAKAILENIIPKMTGISLDEIKNRVPVKRPTIWLGECIGKKIEFETPELQALLNHIRTITVYQNASDAPYEVMDDSGFEFFGGGESNGLKSEILARDNYKLPKYIDNASGDLKKILVLDHKTGRYLFKLNIEGLIIQMGIGGLHSVDSPKILETDDIHQHLELDFSSYYPMMIWKNNFVPEHLPEILEVLIQLIEDRLAKKALGKTGDKDAALYAEMEKVAINSIFGLLGLEYYFLHDVRALLSTTLTGQLGLLMVVERALKHGFHPTSVNTDGVNLRVEHSRMDELEEMRLAIQTHFDIGLETTLYKKMIIRDVNSYIAVIQSEYGNKVKLKGVFGGIFANTSWNDEKEFYNLALYQAHINGIIPDNKTLEKYREIPNFIKGVKHTIIPLALYQYYIHNIPVEKTILGHDNVHDFCVSQKSDTNKFQPVLDGIDENGEHEQIELQKTNRVLVTHTGHSLIKIHKLGGNNSSILSGESVLLMNNIDSEDPKDYPIKYEYYFKEAYKIIDKIAPINDLEF